MENNIFTINSDPIYGIEINKDELLGSLPYAELEYDLFSMMKDIKDAINSTKPNYIDINIIRLSNPKDYYYWDNPIIYLSGKDMNEDMMYFIVELWCKLIKIYKSENLNTKYDVKDIFKPNHLLKAAHLEKITKIYWLDWLALDDNNNTSNEKINKI